MSNYNLALQSNNIDLQTILQTLQNKAINGDEQIDISIDTSTGLVTATAGSKSSTHQLAFQPAKTITPGTASQIAVSSGYYTGGDITVAAVPTQSKSVTPADSSQNVTPDSGKFLSQVTINAIPSSYVQPSGTKTITTNGTHDVKSYASVSVSVASSGGGTSGEDSLITMDISTYTNDRVSSIGPGAFAYASKLKSVNFPAATTIGKAAFAYCSSLTTASFPVATTIGDSAFTFCSSLTTVSFPAVTTIESSAFRYCTSLTTANFPVATFIGDTAFAYCSSLATISFPVATTIESYAFDRCTSLTTVSFPAATFIGDTAFYWCSRLTTVSFPVVTTIGKAAFAYCSSLTTISFPVATTIGSSAFAYCSTLATVSFPAVTTIRSSAFRYCYNLKSLYLTGSKVCRLYASNVFSSTPIGDYSTSAGTYGSIYVPASLLASYKVATNWTYFSSRFVGI